MGRVKLYSEWAGGFPTEASSHRRKLSFGNFGDLPDLWGPSEPIVGSTLSGSDNSVIRPFSNLTKRYLGHS